MSGLSPEQAAFMARQAAARGGPAPPPAAAPVGGGGGGSGLSPEQEEFMRRKRGEVGMTGGLDTHGRPRLEVMDLDENMDDAPNLLGVLAAGMAGFVTGSGVTYFAVMQFRRRFSKSTFRQPLLSA